MKKYFINFIEDLNLPDRRNLFYDGLVIILFLALRSLFFHKFLISALYGPEVGCEIQMYSQVAMDLASGKYFYPIIHGYGIPFMFHYLIGVLAEWTGDPITATGQFQFYMDCFVVPAVYLLGCMTANRKVALVATGLVCFSPIYTAYAMVITVASAVFHVYGFIFLYNAIKRNSGLSACIAGFLFGMPDGGGRFSPFIVASGLASIWLLIGERSTKHRLSKFLIAGWIVSLFPMLAYSISSPLYLPSLIFAFSSRGFAHVVMSRGPFDGIFAKNMEFIIHFFLFNPLIAAPLVAGLFQAGMRIARGNRDVTLSERYILINIGAIAFFLTYVMTYAEPSELTGIRSRPLRYFFIFMPFLEVIAAKAVLQWLESRRGLFGRIFAFPFTRKRAAFVAVALFAFCILAPPPYSDDKTFENFNIGQSTTVLANIAPRSIYHQFRSFKFSVPYTEMLELYPDLPEGKKLKPMEFYARLMFSEPLYQEYEYKGMKVSWRPWFLNLPWIDFDRMQYCGKRAGLAKDVIIYIMEKTAIREVQHRYHEKTFSDTFESQMDDWEFYKIKNPGIEKYIISQDDSTIVLKVPMHHIQYNNVVFRFDRRDLEGKDCDFVVPSTLIYLDEIGFGWRTSANLSDPGDWVNNMEKDKISEGVRVSPLVYNDFSVRSEPGSYVLTLEWMPEDGESAIPFGFSSASITAPIETSTLENGRRLSVVHVNVDDRITINLATSRTFIVYGLSVRKDVVPSTGFP